MAVARTAATEQVITPRQRSSGRKGARYAWVWRYISPEKLERWIKGSAAFIAVTAALVLYRPIVHSSIFDLREVQITGNRRITAAEAEALVREAAPKNMLDIDLTQLRNDLKRRPIVKNAEITRVLPDLLRVRLTERVPVAVVSPSGQTPVCVDAEGVVVGDFHLMSDEQGPLLVGWSEDRSGSAQRENRDRLALFLQLQREMASGSFWNQIDQVDLRNLQDVTVNLAQSPGTWIHLGDREFMHRFDLSLRILNAIRQRNAEQLVALGISPSDEMFDSAMRITYVDVSQPSKAVIRMPSLKRTSTNKSKPVLRPGRRHRRR
ncbi:MAG: FtsQ-type POTRA domain-containing protein [Acidobacteria bacterium]|nr:FtsQ-type POTRA domain-containing protein [Acidobacteriota bacterium]